MRILKALLPKASLSRQVILVVFGDAITFMSGLITSMILARIIPVDEMATYRQVAYLTLLVGSFIQFNLQMSIYRYWKLFDRVKQAVLIKMLVLLSFVLGAIAGIVLIILAPILTTAYDNPALLLALLVTSIFPVVSNLPMLVRPVLICKGHSLEATLFQTVYSLVNISSLIIPFYLGLSIHHALAIWMIACCIFLIWVLVYLREQLLIKSPWWDKKLFGELWEYLWPIQVAQAPSYAIFYTDKIVTSIYLSKTAFAAYSLGARELPFIGKIGQSVATVLIPHIAEDADMGNDERVCKRWHYACLSTAIITYPIVGFCIWFSLPVVQFLFSSRYEESSFPFAVFSAITFIRVIEFGSLAKAYGRNKMIMQASFYAAGSLLILSFPMTYFFQIQGISLAIFFSVLTAAAYQLWMYTRLLKRPLSDFFPWKKLLVIVTISIFSAAVVDILLSSAINLSADTGIVLLGLKLILLFIIQTGFYGSFLVLFRVIDLKPLFTQLRIFSR